MESEKGNCSLIDGELSQLEPGNKKVAEALEGNDGSPMSSLSLDSTTLCVCRGKHMNSRMVMERLEMHLRSDLEKCRPTASICLCMW